MNETSFLVLAALTAAAATGVVALRNPVHSAMALVASLFLIAVHYITLDAHLVAALQILAALVDSGKRASELLHLFDKVPQLLKNVRFAGGAPLEDDKVLKAIAAAEAELQGRGRLVIRPSGTEKLIRVMAEGDDADQVERVVDRICGAVAEAAA